MEKVKRIAPIILASIMLFGCTILTYAGGPSDYYCIYPSCGKAPLYSNIYSNQYYCPVCGALYDYNGNPI